MLVAKSIYLSGQLVAAAQCDYQSYKILGLVCPFCSEAVFLRAGTVRDTTLRNGKKVTQSVPPNFAHYSEVFAGTDCELRSKSKEGKEKLEKLIIEAKNQRLKLFNQRLWELFKKDRNVREKKLIDTSKRNFNSLKEVEDLSRITQKWWKSNLQKVYAYIQEVSDSFDKITTKEAQYNLGLSGDVIQEQKEINKKYFDNVSQQFHIQVCKEIADFLCTPTAALAFYRLVQCAIYTMSFTPPELADTLKIFMQEPEYLSMTIAGQIYGTHWINILKDEMNYPLPIPA